MKTLALIGSLLMATPTSRDEPPAVVVLLSPCVDVDRAAFHRIASAELGPQVTHEGGAPVPTGPVTRVTVTCAPAGTQMLVFDPSTKETLSRTIDLQAIPQQARARLLALAVTELVVASRIELEPVPEPTASAVSAEPPAKAEPPARPFEARAEPRWTIGAGFALRGFSSGVHALPGANVRAHHRPLRHLGWLLDLEVVGRPLERTVGNVDVMLASAASAVQLVVARKRLIFDAGAGARFGAVWMRGRSTDPAITGSQFVAAWGGPMVLTQLGAPLGHRVMLEISAEIGVDILPVVGRHGDRAVVDLDGVFVAGTVGLAGRF